MGESGEMGWLPGVIGSNGSTGSRSKVRVLVEKIRCSSRLVLSSSSSSENDLISDSLGVRVGDFLHRAPGSASPNSGQSKTSSGNTSPEMKSSNIRSVDRDPWSQSQKRKSARRLDPVAMDISGPSSDSTSGRDTVPAACVRFSLKSALASRSSDTSDLSIPSVSRTISGSRFIPASGRKRTSAPNPPSKFEGSAAKLSPTSPSSNPASRSRYGLGSQQPPYPTEKSNPRDAEMTSFDRSSSFVDRYPLDGEPGVAAMATHPLPDPPSIEVVSMNVCSSSFSSYFSSYSSSFTSSFFLLRLLQLFFLLLFFNLFLPSSPLSPTPASPCLPTFFLLLLLLLSLLLFFLLFPLPLLFHF